MKIKDHKFSGINYFNVILASGDQTFLCVPIPWEKKIPPRARRKLLGTPLLFWFQNHNWGWQLNLSGEKNQPEGIWRCEFPRQRISEWKQEGAKLQPVTGAPWTAAGCRDRQMALKEAHSTLNWKNLKIWNLILCSMARLCKWLNKYQRGSEKPVHIFLSTAC